MILTVTPGSAVDRVIVIDEFLPGGTMRTPRLLECVGGKGSDASVVLRELGADTLAMAFVAGDRGRDYLRLLEEHGVRHDCVWCEGETRIAHVLVETRHRRHSHITAGALHVTADAYAEFREKLQRNLRSAAWVAMGGALPAGLPGDFFAEVILAAKAAGVPALIDSYGEPMRQAAGACPAVVKLNRHELAETFGIHAGALPELRACTEQLAAELKLPALVVTCGGDGILAVVGRDAYLACSPQVEEVNAAGAGDAVTGALAWRFAEGDAWPEALRWAAASAAAVVMTEGTAECHRSDVLALLPQIAVTAM